MKSPESIEEERGDEKQMMKGESSRGDTPDKKRVRLRLDGDSDAEDHNPAICAMEEEQQQMMVDVDPEATIQEEDDKGQLLDPLEQVDPPKTEGEASLKLYTREEWAKELAKKNQPTEEQEQQTKDMLRMRIEDYGTDDLEAIDDMIELRCAEQARRYAEKLEKQKNERKFDYKEIQRVETILQKVESLTLQVRRVPTRFTDETSTKEFFVLDPWDDKDFRHRDPDEPSLDLYYKRLFPIVKSAHVPSDPHFWNRLPDVDEQYLSLYSKLCGLVKQDEQSYILHLKSPTTDRVALFKKATQIAKELNLQKLKTDDVYECIENVFREGDIIAEHKLKAEYDVFLLECEYEKLSRSGFIPKDKTPVFECVCFFRPTLQQLKFDKWMENRRHMKCGKEEHRKAIEALHAQNLREDCSTRIRFIKLKRAWAKEHGIISEETCQQGHGDMNEAMVGV